MNRPDSRVNQRSVSVLCAAIVLPAVVMADVLPCTKEYIGNSCELFLPPGPVECAADVQSSGYCPQTTPASFGYENQDPSFAGPTCTVVYMVRDPDTGECVPSGSSYDGPGRCRTASGGSCPSGAPV